MIYFTSDPHFGHKKIALLRDFDTVEQHDEYLLNQYRQLPTNSELWILGDLTSGRKSAIEQALKDIGLIACESGIDFHLIAGNHDPVSEIHRNAHKHQPEWLQSFDSIQYFARRKINKQSVLFCHFPYTGDSNGSDRYCDYQMKDNGKWLVHGHTHQSEVRSIHPRQISIGWDAWHRPVELNEISKIIIQSDNAHD